jgi:hypothetical protein
MGKKTGSGYGMNNPDHISKSFEINFLGLKYLNYLMRISGMGKKSDPGWKTFGSGPGWKTPRIRTTLQKDWH